METTVKFRLHNCSFWSGLLSKKNGRQIADVPFFIYPLSKKHASQMAQLSKEIYQHLKKEEQCFIHKREAAYFENIFNQPDISFIGIFCENKLIGMSYLRTCSDKQTFQEEIPDFSAQTFLNNEKIGTLGGDCVHPDFRGNGLNQLMIEYRLEMAKEKGCSAVYSIIDRHNHWNMTPYFNNRFQMLSCGIDPADGGKIAIMRYRAMQPKRIGNMVCVPTHHFEKIDQLIQNDFVGETYNPKTREIVFTRPADPVHIKKYNHLKIIRRLRNKIRERQYV